MERPTLLVKSGGEAAMPEWQALFADIAPHLDVRSIDDPAVPPERVRYALVWAPAPGRLACLPNLRLIVSSGAGVDHIVSDPDCPLHVPIVRMGGDEAAQRMAEYVCLAALALLRDLPRLLAQQRARWWEEPEPGPTAPETTVGIMGLGNLGAAAALMLLGLGFQVAGWSRLPKSIPGIACFAGPSERAAFLRRTDILVNLLPDTPDTRGMIDGALLSELRPGACVVNAGRGPQLVIADLLQALDASQLAGAVLDVFEQEPLPRDHPIWTHPCVIVTPHVASTSSRRARARYAAEAITAFERGERLPNLYDPVRGY